MVDWSSSMAQSFEYYIVDPNTWKDAKRINDVTSCTITRDSEAETLGSATLDTSETLGECYFRAYLVTIQNGVTERHPLGTFLVQTPSTSFDGKSTSVSLDAYTPLIELKEKLPPLGYAIDKNTNVMEIACRLVSENVRAPVVKTSKDTTLFYDFVSNTDDTWMTFLSDLILNADYTLSLDETGKILFSPNQDIASLQPMWTFNDDNSSILYSDITVDRDLYGVPNVVEVVCSTGTNCYYSRVVNDDPNSPISTVSRGREIIHRVTDPSIMGNPSQQQVNEYARKLLKQMSSIEYTVTYSHGYCPVRLGDCVRLNYTRAGITNVKAKVISQSIKCEPGCPVTEKAVFTRNLWG